MQKSLDSKLTKITSGNYSPESFIIADAKDGDMAFGTQAPGPHPDGSIKTKADYLNAMTEMSHSGLVDIMLMSASSAETLDRRDIFKDSSVTPAIRLNDTTDIWMARNSCYRQSDSRPFATADFEAAAPFASLGLYSMTFANNLKSDLRNLNAYREFRIGSRSTNFDHFLEVFNPPIDIGIAESELGFYINDMIVKAVAGVTRLDAPKFLKIQFNGHKAMEELSQYDPENLIVGILGGAAGTTRDTFELIHQAEQAGARVALFGRKINLAESPIDLVRLMRQTIEQKVTPEAAVNEYHKILADKGLTPQRKLANDMAVSDPVLMA